MMLVDIKILSFLGFPTPRLAEDLLQHLLAERMGRLGVKGLGLSTGYRVRFRVWGGGGGGGGRGS